MIRLLKTTFLLLVIAVGMYSCNTPQSKEQIIKGKKVLVYTKNGKGFVHKNRQASVDAIHKLGEKYQFEVVASDDPAMFTEENLTQFHCIILSNTNNETFDNDRQKKAFVKYIHSGGGIVGIHSACGSERQWPWFWSMLGGKFKRHPPGQDFDIKIMDTTHMATSMLPNVWKWKHDECYYLDHLNPDLHILFSADLRSVEDPKQEEYPGNVFGNYFPLAWCHEFEGGNVFYTALGHDAKHYEDPLFLEHLVGGIAWACSEEETVPVTDAILGKLPME